MTRVKICGLTTPETVEAAIKAGADYLGFMLYPRSPRALTPEQAAPLMEQSAGRVGRVVVTVDPNDDLLAAIAALRPDLIQLHGRETPERVAAVRERTGAPVVKVVPIANADDLATAAAYDADHLMFETKPPADAERPGGLGVPFDWTLLSINSALIPAKAGTQDPALGAEVAGRAATEPTRGGLGPGLRRGERADGERSDTPRPTLQAPLWFLAGGLTPGNVAEAIRVTGAPAVDVSSGVESAPGVKDPALIAAFVRAAKAPLTP